MLYLVLVSALVSLATVVIAQDVDTESDQLEGSASADSACYSGLDELDDVVVL